MDKGQRNFDKKRKPKDTVATMDRGQRGKKVNQQDDFQKLLTRPCPLHPKGKHMILGGVRWRKTKRRRTSRMMKTAIKMEPWDSSNLPTEST